MYMYPFRLYSLPMDQIHKLAITYRAKLVISNLRACHSGCDVHEVGNMLNTAQGILQSIEDHDIDEGKDCGLLEDILTRVEAQQVAFFKRKFEYLNSRPKTPNTPDTPSTPNTPADGEPNKPNTPNKPNLPNEPNHRC